jgi:hypothetical protein
MFIPLEGGLRTAFEGFFASNYGSSADCDPENIVYFSGAPGQGINEAYRADLRTGKLVKLDGLFMVPFRSARIRTIQD